MKHFDVNRASGLPVTIALHWQYGKQAPQLFDPQRTFSTAEENEAMLQLSETEKLEPLIVLKQGEWYFLLPYPAMQQRFAAAYWEQLPNFRVLAIDVQSLPSGEKREELKTKREPKRVTLSSDTTLFHGSTRLYSLTCYIRRQRPILQRYLSDLHANRLTSTEADDKWIGLAARTLSKYEILLTPIPDQPWTMHVLFLFLMTKMYESSRRFRVSSALDPLISDEIKSRPFRAEALERLRKWMQEVEKQRNLDDIDQQTLLEVPFFSVMRQPVQFFADEKTALRYGKDTDRVYVYRTLHPVQLVNISDVPTIRTLMADGYPFASWYFFFCFHMTNQIPRLPYETKTIAHFAEFETVADARLAILASQKAWYLEPIENKLADWEIETSRLDELWKQKYKWTYPDRQQRPFTYETLDEWLKDTSWPQLVSDMVNDVYRNQNDTIWNYLVHQVKATSNNDEAKTRAIVEHILQRWPDREAIYEDLAYGWQNTFLDLMEGANLYWTQDKRKQRIRDKQKWLVGQARAWISDLSTTFEARDPKALEQLLVPEFEYSFLRFERLANNLAKEWPSLFTNECISPRGLWLFTNWRILHSTGTVRKSIYEIDTLIVQSFRTSEFVKKAEINGWICMQPYEVMIIYPERFGSMQKQTATFDFQSPACIYDED